ncbi:MAG: hypothetical protein J0H06_05930 [Actinobacteria bacterium]|nr:hypothetical protein [Actinomycetota bacterium]
METRRSRRLWPLSLLVLVALLLPLGCGGGAGRARAGDGGAGGAVTCNGSEALCSHRLDQVVFPGTHNSFAASAEPGWHFAGQKFGIARQLDDGIRALLLDVHYGVRAPDGVVRTDFAAEGADTNKVMASMPPRALRVAERIAGTLGVGLPAGKPRLYLCHTLCELGADPLDRELKGIATFLASHPRTFLMLIVEDYVPAARIAAAFREAGLASLAATLPRHGPQPTLGRLLGEGKRLAVFSEQRGGDPSWYMPAFSYIEDTPLGAHRPDQLSCARNRGEPDAPLLLINHWIPPFPPSPRLNAAIGRSAFLGRRVRRCLRDRGAEGAIVAVDFYERTAVVRVAAELNEAGG